MVLCTGEMGLVWQALRNLYQPVVQRSHAPEVLVADVYELLP